MLVLVIEHLKFLGYFAFDLTKDEGRRTRTKDEDEDEDEVDSTGGSDSVPAGCVQIRVILAAVFRPELTALPG